MKRTLVFGDIHGGLKALIQLLEKVEVKENDKLIFLGDYVDGWSESAQVIDFLMHLTQKQECIFIRGNHDVWCHEWLKNGVVNDIWFLHGGKSTIESYQNINSVVKERHFDFFENMKDYFVDEYNNLFIHAGFSSMHGPEKEHYASNFSWDRTLWEMGLTMDRRIQKDSLSYPKRLLLYNEIYIGHTPTIHYNIEIPMQGCNVWNIDTGAGFYGKLTCLDIETKAFWQSDVVQTFYPGEKGRNK
ncbi:metallophosphoesterase family protein [Flavobacterium sp. Fl-77]|uniref:Metallophosphoesterase family protein n=1 Tax=Flavobacterium flavipigmentatum TaxID=2893884 RepID=A0AAJ2VVR3_9FLAO|nr:MULTISPECIES: metallophosphoesterase family protein [unclassified Flavobacterium]MDX6180763.1 metallophosphoesterase family protein [Flavobacterium sp. Fl-33]MDX6184363.1 metallophosphoesterase family protein [Flavobacterium sp. Fl-77]UFH39472.1 serine/threonine protein phosphatase [Flavobacterium sp. F-70]